MRRKEERERERERDREKLRRERGLECCSLKNIYQK